MHELGVQASGAVWREGGPALFFFLFLCSDADRLPVFVRLSISGAGQVGEGQGALKAEVPLPQKNIFLDVKACIGFSLIIRIRQRFSTGVPQQKITYSDIS